MFKFVVLSALLAVVAAKPGHLLGHSAVVAAPLAYHHAPVYHHAPAIHHAIPAAVSHSSRVDVISKPVIHTVHAAPIVHAPVVHAPVVHAHVVHAAPIVHASPIVHAAPVHSVSHHGISVGHGLSYGHGLAYAGHGLAGHGIAYGHHY